MVNLRIPRTATFAWSPGNHLPQIVTGTVAGVVTADFSNDTFLELWDLSMESGVSEGAELAPKATINTDSRFFDVAWGNATSDRPRGIIAGGLESGSLNLWDAAAIDSGEGELLISQTAKHTGPIKALQFNPFKPELLLTGGVKGEIYVWDLNNIANPFLLGNRAQRADDFASVDWNKKIPHILLSGGQNGLVTVWDVKQKKESLTLSHLGRKEVSAVAWHPENATKLLTALPDDSNPVVMVWDLRNANAPERTLSGHEQGVLSLAWCKQDVDLLLSSGKDNRTICWNPNTGERLGEFPIGTNWTFQTRFNPRIPDIMASASYDGKISIQSLQNKQTQTNRADSSIGALDGEDFFNKASFDPQGPSFSLKQPPKWYRCPVGASFGFGGKLVSFVTPPVAAGQPVRSKIRISKFFAESEVSESTESFEKAITGGNLTSLCDTRVEEAKTEDDKADWRMLKTLFEADKKAKIKEYLGFKSSDEDELSEELAATKLTDDSKPEETQTNGDDINKDWFSGDEADDGDNFLSSLSSTKGARTNNPFKIYSGSESESDKKITNALVLGNFDRAVDICLKKDRLSDAWVLAIAGGQKTIDKVQKAYFGKQANGPNYLRVLASIVGKNLWDVVYNADLADWKEVMVSLCTFADDKEFSDLCEALGERIEEESQSSGNKELRRDAALCYLVGSKLERVVNIWIEEYKEIESASLKEAESSATSFSVHVRSLQQLIEKVTVFREATKFVDTELSAPENWKLAPLYDKYCEYADVVASQGQLDIAERYLNLLPLKFPAAEISRNRVKHASGKAAPAASAARIVQARQPAAAGMIPASTVAPQTGRTMFTPAQPAQKVGVSSYPGAPVAQQQPPMQTPMQTAQTGIYGQQSNQYTPPTATSGYNPPAISQYTPASAATSNYTPTGYQPPGQMQPQAPRGPYQPQIGGGGYPGAATQGPPPGPPRTFSPATTGPPPKSHQQKQDIPAWNDTPIIEPRRRQTPSQSSATGPRASPFPNAPPTTSSPTAFTPPQRGGTPGAGLPPPPKGALPPQRVVSPPQGGGYMPQAPPQGPPQHNLYGQPQQQPPPPATNTTYAPPPPSASASGRYTPQAPAGGPLGGAAGGPPMQSGGRYTPQAQSQYQPGPPQAGPPMGGMGGPPMGAPPMGGPPMGGSQYAPPPPAKTPTGVFAPPPRAGTSSPRPGTQGSTGSGGPPKAATPAPKYPAGDRSHIPETARPIFDLLSADMERVKSVAPPNFKRQVQDTEKRLNILFDHLNNESLLTSQTVTDMVQLADALTRKEFQTALDIQADIHKNRMDECGNWMVGVKRLIEMSRAAP